MIYNYWMVYAVGGGFPFLAKFHSRREAAQSDCSAFPMKGRSSRRGAKDCRKITCTSLVTAGMTTTQTLMGSHMGSQIPRF